LSLRFFEPGRVIFKVMKDGRRFWVCGRRNSGWKLKRRVRLRSYLKQDCCHFLLFSKNYSAIKINLSRTAANLSGLVLENKIY
jgi:hypothetical protein